MLTLTRCVRLALCLLVLAPAAAAESLVQLTFHGELTADGGAYVQVEIDRWAGDRTVAHDLHAHLARGTSAHDLASLLNARLTAAGADVRFPGEGTGDPTEAHLFVEHATAVNLRLGFGLSAEVTTCEEAPLWIRFDEPQLQQAAATLHLTATTFHQHLKKPGRLSLELPIAADANTAQLSKELAERSTEAGWIGERPSPDRWSPLRSEVGGAVIACNIRLVAPNSDWRLEVKLREPGS